VICRYGGVGCALLLSIVGSVTSIDGSICISDMLTVLVTGILRIVCVRRRIRRW